jgi:hypothetical protein
LLMPPEPSSTSFLVESSRGRVDVLAFVFTCVTSKGPEVLVAFNVRIAQNSSKLLFTASTQTLLIALVSPQASWSGSDSAQYIACAFLFMKSYLSHV